MKDETEIMSETAILMAAGLGTRMMPLTQNTPKPLIKVHGKPMIETVIDGLKARGVEHFIAVVGYMGDQFGYLEEKYENLRIVENRDYESINNISSIYAVADELIGTDSDIFICEADLYVSDKDFFRPHLTHSCYFGKMVNGHSDDWVFDTDENGRITRVGKVGDDLFNMVGVAWFKKSDARLLGQLIKDRYGKQGYEDLFWDDVVNENLDKLDLIVHEIEASQVTEIDAVEELAEVDESYILNGAAKADSDVLRINILSMDGVLRLIDNTVEKSTITDFRGFLTNYPDVTKWILCSDYCFGDKGKPNDVISFVLYPYVFGFTQWQDIIDTLQSTDIKNARHISEAFRKFTHLGLFFSFNFVFDKSGSFFDEWRKKEVLVSIVDQYIDMMDTWKVTTPHRADIYDKFQCNLKRLRTEMNANNFNVRLFHKTIITVYLASYVKYLLFREVDKMEMFSWLSDRDKMTSLSNGVYGDLYVIMSHCICAQRLPEDKNKGITEMLPANPNENMFWDSLNRTADIICGILADHNTKTNEVSKDKHLEGVEDILANNPNIVILGVGEKGISRGTHTKL